jgi:hypothetical protein
MYQWSNFYNGKKKDSSEQTTAIGINQWRLFRFSKGEVRQGFSVGCFRSFSGYIGIRASSIGNNDKELCHLQHSLS